MIIPRSMKPEIITELQLGLVKSESFVVININFIVSR